MEQRSEGKIQIWEKEHERGWRCKQKQIHFIHPMMEISVPELRMCFGWLGIDVALIVCGLTAYLLG